MSSGDGNNEVDKLYKSSQTCPIYHHVSGYSHKPLSQEESIGQLCSEQDGCGNRGEMTHDRANEVQEYEETHREQTETAKLGQESQLDQIVDSRVNPATTLRQQHAKAIWSNSMCNGVRGELHLECREVGHHDGCQISIFTQREQVLLV